MISFGEQIKKYRKKRNLTQKKLAELTGLNEVTIRCYELGKYQPKQDNMLKICKALDMPTQYEYMFSQINNNLPTSKKTEKENIDVSMVSPFYNLSIELRKLGFKLYLKDNDNLNYYTLKSKNTTITVSKEELYLFNNDLQEMRKNDINFLIKQLFDKHKNNND